METMMESLMIMIIMENTVVAAHSLIDIREGGVQISEEDL